MQRLAGLPPPFASLVIDSSRLTFHLGDSLTLLALLPPASIDVVVTSPPYNLGIRYRTYEDALPRDEYLAWTGRWVAAVARVLTEAGSLFLNVGAKPTDPWAAMDMAQAARPHLTLQNTLHWIKSIAIDKEAVGGSGLRQSLAVGHYKPINSPRFVNDCHEFLFHFTKHGRTPLDREAVGVPYQDKTNIARWRGRGTRRDRRCRGNAWFLPYDTIKSRDKDRPHPATFPAKLPEQCIRLHGRDRARLVLDPFTGLGSTAVACARLGVDFIGMDLDEVYLAEAVRRVEASVAQRPLGLPE